MFSQASSILREVGAVLLRRVSLTQQSHYFCETCSLLLGRIGTKRLKSEKLSKLPQSPKSIDMTTYITGGQLVSFAPCMA